MILSNSLKFDRILFLYSNIIILSIDKLIVFSVWFLYFYFQPGNVSQYSSFSTLFRFHFTDFERRQSDFIGIIRAMCVSISLSTIHCNDACRCTSNVACNSLQSRTF